MKVFKFLLYFDADARKMQERTGVNGMHKYAMHESILSEEESDNEDKSDFPNWNLSPDEKFSLKPTIHFQ